MSALQKDLVVDDEKFKAAAADMEALKKRTAELKKRLDKMYQSLSEAMDTPAGREAKIEAKSVLLKPVENMSLVVGHISGTLNRIIGRGFYKDVFTGFEELSKLL